MHMVPASKKGLDADPKGDCNLTVPIGCRLSTDLLDTWYGTFRVPIGQMVHAR